jgi:hypothetical protein
MTENTDDLQLAEDIERVSTDYRSIATEKVPAWLDKKVLRDAAADPSKSPFAAAFVRWARPLVFVATAGLSLALLLELNQAPGVDDSVGFDRLVPVAGQSDNQVSAGSAEALSRAVEESGKRLKDMSFSSDAVQTNTTNRSCSEQESIDPVTWWLCIESLQESGRTTDALSELALLEARFPDFSPPE